MGCWWIGDGAAALAAGLNPLVAYSPNRFRGGTLKPQTDIRNQPLLKDAPVPLARATSNPGSPSGWLPEPDCCTSSCSPGCRQGRRLPPALISEMLPRRTCPEPSP